MTDETTQTVEPETPSMSFLSDESMNEIFDKAQSEDEPTATEPEATEPLEVKPDATVTDESATETDVEPTAETTEPEQAKPETEQVKPPASWTAEAKEKFLASDPVIQQEVLKRETDFNKKMESSAESRKFAEQFEQVVGPYRASIAADGGEPLPVFQSLLNTAYTLRHGTDQQKESIVRSMISQYGINPEVLNNDSDEFIDPQISGLQSEIAELKNKLLGQETAQQQTVQSNAVSEIEKFRNETDEKGNAKHPHFDAVKADMSKLLNAGLAPTLNDAYEKAIYSNSEIRSTILADQAKADEAKRVEDLKKKANEAKKAAGTNLSSKGTVEQGTVGKFLSDESMGAIFDKIESAA